jgi:hypothetical protein
VAALTQKYMALPGSEPGTNQRQGWGISAGVNLLTGKRNIHLTITGKEYSMPKWHEYSSFTSVWIIVNNYLVCGPRGVLGVSQ